MKNSILLVLGLCALATTSCVDKFDSSKKPAGKTEELQVPDTFDWETTQNVEFDVTAPGVARIAVSETADGEPFATFFAGGKFAAEPVSLSIPAAVSTLYVSYATQDGMSAPRAVNVSNGTAQVAVGSNGRPFDDIDIEQTENLVYIPSRADGWATMMFEDSWPSYGDYDFNDLVFNYKIQLSMTGNTVESMVLGVRMKAKGGSFPYRIYLWLRGMRMSQIGGNIECIAHSNTVNDKEPVLTFLQSDPVKVRPLLRFDGIYENKNKQVGAIWTNTEAGYELADDQLVTATFVVEFKEAVKLSEVDFTGLDFFLGRTGEGTDELGTEIHRANYDPLNTSLYYQADQKNLHARNYFMSKDNLVWAVNIPADVKHAYEGTDFLKAYPAFATWAESAGRNAKDWYKNGVRENLVSKK